MLIGILFVNYGPYHLSRIESFYSYCNRLGWQVVGIELSRFENQYPWRVQISDLPFQIISLTEKQEVEKTSPIQSIQKLYSVLSQIKPDVLAIAGYANPTMLAALGWCLYHQKPAILMSESKEDDAARNWWQEKLKIQILKTYKAALVGGRAHRRYLTKLGMASKAIFFGYDVIGNDSFQPEKIECLPQPLAQPYFLSINRFVAKKNLFFILAAYANYRQIAGERAWDLVLCGDGCLRSQIEQQLEQLGIQNFVHLPGFLQQNELLPYFAHAGCFIHASIQEQWGLVVNEAMAAGLPVLVSNHCGCFEDLVIEGINGFGFDPQNERQLVDLMLKMSSEKIDLPAMRQAALKHIQQFSPDYFAQGLTDAVEYAIACS